MQKIFSPNFPALLPANDRVYQCSISGRSRKLQVFPNLVKVIKPDRRTFRPNQTPPKRTEITGFSAKSQNRLRKYLATISREQMRNSYMLTLTYPKNYESDFRTYKNHLFAWRKRIERKNPDINHIWKLEFQERGAPHFHILLFFPKKLTKEEFRQEIFFHKKAWFEIVNSNDEKHFKAGTRFEGANNFGQLSHYISKYLGKNDFIPANTKTGRIWGKSRSFCEEIITEINLTESETQRATDLLIYLQEERIGKPMSDNFLKWAHIVPTISFFYHEQTIREILTLYNFFPPITQPCEYAFGYRPPAG